MDRVTLPQAMLILEGAKARAAECALADLDNAAAVAPMHGGAMSKPSDKAYSKRRLALEQAT
jgi:hypothetical protein